jgi:hypothetical protein
MATSVLTAKQRIKTLIEATLTDFEVLWGYNGRTVDRHTVIVGEAVWEESSWAGIGTTKPRNEVYSVNCSLFRTGALMSNEEMETEAIGFFNTLETAFRNDPTLSGLLLQGLEVIPNNIGSIPDDSGGAVGIVEFSLRCKARI